jgi:hypothetical protein
VDALFLRHASCARSIDIVHQSDFIEKGMTATAPEQAGVLTAQA